MVLAGYVHWIGKITQRERIESKRRSIVYKLQYEVEFGHLRRSNNQLQGKDKSQAPSVYVNKEKKRQSGVRFSILAVRGSASQVWRLYIWIRFVSPSS